ncbi:hypothetical protein ACOSQ2_023734 [Xanthoceras sorbifolium]
MGGPWNFDNALLVLQIPSGYGDFSEMSFQWSDFWIQIHNAPLICMTKNIGLMLGERIGKVKDIDVGASGDCFGKFLRVKVSIDVTKPLKRVLRVKLDGSKAEKMLLLKYERMPEYCFCCGLIGHPFRECPGESEDHEPVCNKDFAFGTWMRASSPSKDRPHGFMPKSNGPSTTRNKTQADTTGTIPIASVRFADASGIGGTTRDNANLGKSTIKGLILRDSMTDNKENEKIVEADMILGEHPALIA